MRYWRHARQWRGTGAAALLSGALVLGASAAPAAAGGIDTTSKESVGEAYRTRLAPALKVRVGWTGSVSSCRLGSESAASRRATLSAINVVRELVQLDHVVLSSTANTKALRTALLMQANGGLSHSPTRSAFSSCWSGAGAAAAGRSNLFLALGAFRNNLAPSTGARAVLGYMKDSGAGNLAVGHRRWLLNPTTRVMATGSTSSANALTVTGLKTSRKAARPTWIEWPAQGYFPQQLEPGGRWSLSASSARVSFARARVSVRQVTATGATIRRLRTTVHRASAGYGPATVVFSVKGVSKAKGAGTVRYKVPVTGVTRGTKTVSRAYTVKLFDASTR